MGIPTDPRPAITGLLDRMMPPGRGRPWRDGNLFVDLQNEADHGLFSEYEGWDPGEVRLVEQALGYHPTWAVAIDVSGRIDGTHEIRAFLAQIITNGGVATDDYSSHCWTLQEIQDEVKVDGLAFFDFNASYERSRQPRAQTAFDTPSQ